MQLMILAQSDESSIKLESNNSKKALFNFLTSIAIVAIIAVAAYNQNSIKLDFEVSQFFIFGILVIIMRPLGKDTMTNFYFESQMESGGQLFFKKFAKYQEFVHLSEMLRYIFIFIAVYNYNLLIQNSEHQIQIKENQLSQTIQSWLNKYNSLIFALVLISIEILQIFSIFNFFYNDKFLTNIFSLSCSFSIEILRLNILVIGMFFIFCNRKKEQIIKKEEMFKKQNSLKHEKTVVIEEQKSIPEDIDQSSSSISLYDNQSLSVYNLYNKHQSNPINIDSQYMQLTKQEQKVIRSESVQITNSSTNDDLFNKMNNISMLCVHIQKNINPEDKKIKLKRHNTQSVNQTMVLEIHKLSKSFFNEIPNSRQSQNNIEFIKPKSKMTHAFPNKQTKIFKDVKSIFENKQNEKRNVDFYQLQNKYHDILDQKIYEPYFISNNTILQYQNQDSNNKLSFCQIIQQFLKESKNQSKLYFKVGKDKKDDQINQHDQTPRQNLIGKSSSFKNVLKTNKVQDEELQDSINPFYTNEKEGFWKNKALQIQDVEYFEFDLKKFEIQKQKYNESLHFSMLQQIDNFYLQGKQDHSNNFILINIRNISNIIKSQQRLSDQMYLDATEQNYSHEQMTPLNSILANSKIIYRRFQELIKQQLNQFKKNNEDQNYETAKKKNDESLKILKAIHQSGQIMWYYNQNQIQRMKIQKNEFQKRKTLAQNLEDHIERVINPFEPQILSRNLKIFIAKKRNFDFIIKNDWIMYQLILFNIIQNAVKYNMFEGNIIVLLDCKPKPVENNKKEKEQTQQFEDEETHIFETEIIDTGIGISEERQDMLFIPFMELKMRQNLKQVQDHNIGMGLGCSQQIVSKLGGDITIKQSKRGLTIFAFKLPVSVKKTQKIEQIDDKSNVSNISSKELSFMVADSDQIKQNEVEALEVNKEALQYINNQKIFNNLKKFKFADIELPPEKSGQMLEIMKLQNKKLLKNKLQNKSNSHEVIENEFQNIGAIERQSDNQQFRNENKIQLDFNNQQNGENRDQNKNKSSSVSNFPLKNILQQQVKNRFQSIIKNNKNNMNSKVLKQGVLINSSMRSLDKHQLISDDEYNQNQEILQQLQKQINKESQSNVNNKSNEINLQNRVKKSRSFSQYILQPIYNGQLINMVNKNHSQQIQLQGLKNINDIKIQNNQISQNQLIDGQQVNKKQKILLKPQNQLLNDDSNIKLKNKNINRELANEEKRQLAINILINNHQDNLQQKIGFNFRNNNQDIQQDVIIQNSQDSNEIDQSQSSQDDAQVLDVIINDINYEDQEQWKQSQQISFQQQAILQLQNLKHNHNQHFSQNYDQNQNQKEILQMGNYQNQMEGNKDVLLQNKSFYYEDYESENSVKFQQQKSIGQSIKYIINNQRDKFCFDDQSIFKQINRKNLSKIQEQKDEAIEEKKNIIKHDNNLIRNSQIKYYGKQVEQKKEIEQKKEMQIIMQKNLESIKENENSASSIIDKKNQLQFMRVSFNPQESKFKNQSIMSQEEEKKIEKQIDKQQKKLQNLKIGLISNNKQLAHISSKKLLQIPELEIPEYLQKENGCGCIPKILIVDDIEFNIIPVKIMIKENFDIDIDEASNGAIALKMYKELLMKPCGCENRTYSLIFMDLQMPVMGGMESSEKIMNLMQRQNLNNSGSLIQKVETTIVVLSAFTDKKIKEECYEIGIRKFLNKPLHYQQLHKIMSLYYYKIQKDQYKDIYKETFNKSYTSSQN